ncbi:Glucokinase [Stylophora pistillata]|uniref:Phosphotransferase n=1 Tax=Stylophora pistillata TaxID=50429 RepID=A0A2B4SV83_STYPI|nr:Glucokinase [Stylophora pistillata]
MVEPPSPLFHQYSALCVVERRPKCKVSFVSARFQTTQIRSPLLSSNMFSAIPFARSLFETLTKALTGRDEVLEVLGAFDLSNESLEEIMSLLMKDFEKGLSADESERAQSPIKMLPTYVRAIPDGSEVGDFLALDLGGTNFRVLKISVEDGKVNMESDIFPLAQDLMISEANILFDYIAGCISLFVKKNKISEKSLPLGFTFSFPVKQLSLTSGLLIRWTKGFSVAGVENEDVVKLLHEALVRTGVSASVDVVALVNDTTEWGAFGDNGSWNHLRTKYDEQVDKESLNPGMQLFEKMISGMYLGELCRIVCMNLADKKLLFNGQVSDKFKTKNCFLTKFVSDVESHERHKIEEVLKEMEVEKQTSESDIEILQRVCAALSIRAARLAAAGVATIVKKTGNYTTTIAVDGSLFKKHPQFKRYMQETLSDILPQGDVTLMLSEDGSGKGAALIAAVASKSKKH